MTFGANPDDWAHFDLVLGLTADLLPVVSNPGAAISPESSIKDIGKLPSIYNRERQVVGIAKWTSQQSTSEQVARWAKESDYGICIQTRTVRAIDVDVTDPDEAQAILARISERFHLPARTRSNSSKFLLAFQLGGDYTKRKFATAHGIVEFLATGQQFVAIGQHKSGSRYEWAGGLPDEFPVLTSEEFEELWTDLADTFAIESPSQSSASVKNRKLADVVSSDPVAQYLMDKSLVLKVERDQRMHIECPFKDEHTSDSSESATTYFPAHTGGYANGHFLCMHAHCEHRTDEEFKAALGYVEDVMGDFDVLTTEPAPESGVEFPFKVLTVAEFCNRPAASWTIKHVLPQADLGVLFGESGSGKSFIALDMAVAIAQGLPWRGNKTKPGRVMFIAAEGSSGFSKRLEAYSEAHGLDKDTLNIGIIDAAPSIIETKTVVALAKSILGQGGADLIFVDTLAQTIAGANENASEDIGKVIANCKGLKRATGAMVVLIHHAGKDSSKGARGWSGLRAAADVELEVSRADHDRVMRVTKQKDGEDGTEFGFRLKSVHLGEDDDGEAITSCIVEDAAVVPPSMRKKEPKGAIERLVLRVVEEAADFGGATQMDVIDRTVEQMPAEEGKRDTRRQRTMRAIENLLGGGVIKNEGNLLTSAGL